MAEGKERRTRRKLSASEELVRAAREALESQIESNRPDTLSDLGELASGDVVEPIGDAIGRGREIAGEAADRARRVVSDVVGEDREISRDALEESRRAVSELRHEGRRVAGDLLDEGREIARDAVDEVRDRMQARPAPPRRRPDPAPPPPPLRRPDQVGQAPSPPARRDARRRIRPGWFVLLALFVISIVRRLL